MSIPSIYFMAGFSGDTEKLNSFSPTCGLSFEAAVAEFKRGADRRIAEDKARSAWTRK